MIALDEVPYETASKETFGHALDWARAPGLLVPVICSCMKSSRANYEISEQSLLCWPHRLTRRERRATTREGLSKAGNARVRRGMIQLT
jgi:hypothetical protein